MGWLSNRLPAAYGSLAFNDVPACRFLAGPDPGLAHPSGAADAFLSGASCPAATSCNAAGHFFNSTNMELTLA